MLAEEMQDFLFLEQIVEVGPHWLAIINEKGSVVAFETEFLPWPCV